MKTRCATSILKAIPPSRAVSCSRASPSRIRRPPGSRSTIPWLDFDRIRRLVQAGFLVRTRADRRHPRGAHERHRPARQGAHQRRPVRQHRLSCCRSSIHSLLRAVPRQGRRAIQPGELETDGGTGSISKNDRVGAACFRSVNRALSLSASNIVRPANTRRT